MLDQYTHADFRAHPSRVGAALIEQPERGATSGHLQLQVLIPRRLPRHREMRERESEEGLAQLDRSNMKPGTSKGSWANKTKPNLLLITSNATISREWHDRE